MPSDTNLPAPHDVLTFWFGDALVSDWPAQDRSALWFGGGAALDARITTIAPSLLPPSVQLIRIALCATFANCTLLACPGSV